MIEQKKKNVFRLKDLLSDKEFLMVSRRNNISYYIFDVPVLLLNIWLIIKHKILEMD